MKYDLYTLENNDLKVVISSLGGTIVSFTDKSLNRDIALGFKKIDDYPGNGEFFGAMVGRCANRIGKGTFKINDKEYHTDINNGPNSLHGGSATYAFKNFELVSREDKKLVLLLKSYDGEAGYPGNFSLIVSYELKNNHFIISYTGESDKDTLCNITNHCYFNLDEKTDTILNHEALIPSERICLNDDDGMATDKVIDVKGTSFDFTEWKTFGENFNKKHENLSRGGIDHNYVFENMDMKLLIKMRNKDLELSVYADTPGLQIYTSNFIEDTKGKEDYHQYAGVAIEPQHCPNAINYDGFIKPILKKGDIQKHTFEYVLERR